MVFLRQQLTSLESQQSNLANGYKTGVIVLSILLALVIIAFLIFIIMTRRSMNKRDSPDNGSIRVNETPTRPVGVHLPSMEGVLHSRGVKVEPQQTTYLGTTHLGTTYLGTDAPLNAHQRASS